jgi:hypothetical protein
MTCTAAATMGASAEAGDHPMETAMHNILCMVPCFSLPHLTTIRLEYHNRLYYGCEGTKWRFVSFPEIICNLEISYSFHEDMPEFLRRALRTSEERTDFGKWSLCNVQWLYLRGVSEGMVKDLVERCPKLGVLELDGCRIVGQKEKGVQVNSVDLADVLQSQCSDF